MLQDHAFLVVQCILTRQKISLLAKIPGSWEDRLPASDNSEDICRFLKNWQFNDYAELYHLETGDGSPGNMTWQSFEVFCCSFRKLLSLWFKDCCAITCLARTVHL